MLKIANSLGPLEPEHWAGNLGARPTALLRVSWNGRRQYGRIQREDSEDPCLAIAFTTFYNNMWRANHVSNCLRSMKWDPESPECERMLRVRRCEWSSCFGDEHVVLPSVQLMRWAWVRMWFLVGSFKMCRLYTWWLIPLSKWVITPVINGISRVNPLITGLITHLLSGMSHQVVF